MSQTDVTPAGTGVRHVVLFTWVDGVTPAQIDALKQGLAGMPVAIPEIRDYRFGADLGVNPLPFVMAVMIAASASFSTPFGYQTNMMVYGLGGYRMTDYLRFGLPMNALLFITAMVIIPWVWPL